MRRSRSSMLIGRSFGKEMILEGRRTGRGRRRERRGRRERNELQLGETEERRKRTASQLQFAIGPGSPQAGGDRRSGTQPLNGSCSADAAALARRAIEGRPACTSCSASSFGSLCARVALQLHGPMPMAGPSSAVVRCRWPVCLRASVSPFLKLVPFPPSPPSPPIRPLARLARRRGA